MTDDRPTLRLGTRGSALALWQAEHIAGRLADHADVEIITIKTTGDRVQDRPLNQVGGSALFTAEIERALLDDEVDLAVHSHKDLATASPEELVIAAVPERADPRDRLLVHAEAYDAARGVLPIRRDAVVGTSSPRRAQQLVTLRPDLTIKDLRGNVPTRVDKLRGGRYDAIVLAAAGLDRLGLALGELRAVTLEHSLMVPAPAQGALGVQCRRADTETVALLRRVLHDEATAAAIDAERKLLVWAGGGCHLPLGCWITSDDEGWSATAFLGADEPEEGAPARWSSGRGATSDAAAQAAWDALASGEATQAGPLAGTRVALVGRGETGANLGARIEALGGTVERVAVLEIEDVRAPDLVGRVARLKEGDAIAVTSQEAARRMGDISVPAGVTLAAVGPGTATALASVGLKAGLVGRGGAKTLARELPVEPGAQVLFPCSESPREDLPRALDERGVAVDKVVLYRTVAREAADPPGEADVLVYMSPSAVVAALAMGLEADLPETPRLGMGAATADALADEGLAHVRPNGSGPEAVVSALLKLVVSNS